MICNKYQTVFLILLAGLRAINGFGAQSVTSVRPARVAIFSQVEESVEKAESEAKENVPYVVSRGDGSVGGGGLAMPRVSEEDDKGLRRPKVGAEMPVGRPSWFRVPGPSQGKDE